MSLTKVLKLLVVGINAIKTCLDVVNSITLTQMNSKFYYNKKHQSMILVIGNY